MIAHQDVGMERAAVSQQSRVKSLQIALPVIVVKKARQAIVAALDNVLKDAWKVRSRKSGHV